MPGVAMSATLDESSVKHTIPVIDRLMDVLGELEHHDDGLTIRALTATLKLPRTTIYRILNTLQPQTWCGATRPAPIISDGGC